MGYLRRKLHLLRRAAEAAAGSLFESGQRIVEGGGFGRADEAGNARVTEGS